jgi:hypothetical protein
MGTTIIIDCNMKTLYYYYYLFYKKLFVEADPGFTAILVLSFSESLFIIMVLNFISAYFFCWTLTAIYMSFITLIIVLVNNIFFFNAKKIKEIIKTKPKFFGSHNISILITWLFFLVTNSSLFWMDYFKVIAENCKSH